MSYGRDTENKKAFLGDAKQISLMEVVLFCFVLFCFSEGVGKTEKQVQVRWQKIFGCQL